MPSLTSPSSLSGITASGTHKDRLCSGEKKQVMNSLSTRKYAVWHKEFGRIPDKFIV
jgi:hypothetical protein